MAITQTHSRMVSDVDAGSTYATTTALAAKADTSSLGTASALNVGTSASNVVQLDGSAKLPAVDGSALTNVSSGGAWRYLATVTAATSASVVFNSTYITSTYDSYMIEMIDVFNSEAARNLELVTSTDNGAGYRSTNYDNVLCTFQNNSTNQYQNAGSSQSMIQLHSSSTTAIGDAWSGTMYIHSPTTATARTTIMSQHYAYGSSNSAVFISGGNVPAEAVNNVKLYHNVGNTTGTFRLYGLSKS